MNLPFRLSARKPFDVLGLGLNAVDFLCVVPHFPHYDSKLRMLDFRQAGGGQAATAMVACQRLGLKTSYLGKIGGGDFGDYSRKGLEEEGVNTEGVVVVPGARNQFAFILIDGNTGERTIIWDRDPRLTMLPEDVPRDSIASAKVLLVDGHDAPAAVRASRFAREEGVLVMMDAERISEETAELVSLADIVIGEKHFPQTFTGRIDLREALTSIADRGPCIAGVTLGDEGALVFCDGEFYHSPAYEVSCRDTTGAGDVFHAAFIRALFESWNLMRCLDFSNAVAALKCRDLGGRAGLPSFAEAAAFMEKGKRCRIKNAGFLGATNSDGEVRTSENE